MTNEEQKLREFATKIVPVIINAGLLCNTEEIIEAFTGDLTALISENYVDKDIHDRLVERADELTTELEELKLKYDKVFQQRDELREALKLLMAGVNRLPPLTGIHGALENQYKIAEAAIKNTENHV